MSLHLIRDPWLPVRRESGQKMRIAPWQITEKEDPILAIESGRPDFDGALAQFLIGLLQTMATPQDHDQWVDWLENPPEPEVLQKAFAKYEHAFEVAGDGPKFMQDFDDFEVKQENLIAELLIDAPGNNTIKENRDHFVKRGEIEVLCSSCAIIALYTLQINAPSGGSGHRTSLRGGGPLTTLIVLDPKGSTLAPMLWRNIWLNILDNEDVIHLSGNAQKKAEADIFPWLHHTRTSESTTGRSTTPEEVNPLQMYWNMPRRIRLTWNTNCAGICSLCSEDSDLLVSHYRSKNYGVNYEGAWQHPLSPHIRNKKTEVFIPQHPQPGGLSYRHWLHLSAKTNASSPAFIAEIFSKKRQINGEQFRLYAFGYDMDNMKARCWYETIFPVLSVPSEQVHDLVFCIEALIDAATQVAKALQSSVKEAWFSRPGDAKGDTSFLTDAFYHHTEHDFFSLIKQLSATLAVAGDEVAIVKRWHEVIVAAAMELFGYWTTRSDFSQEDPRRIAQAHTNLRKKLYSKAIKKLLKLT